MEDILTPTNVLSVFAGPRGRVQRVENPEAICRVLDLVWRSQEDPSFIVDPTRNLVSVVVGDRKYNLYLRTVQSTG